MIIEFGLTYFLLPPSFPALNTQSVLDPSLSIGDTVVNTLDMVLGFTELKVEVGSIVDGLIGIM